MSIVPKRPLDVKLLLASLAISAGIVLVILGVRASVTGREEQQLPDAIEEVEPIRGATQTPSQSEVFVDLLPGYDAVLILNGLELETVSLDDLGTGTSVPKPGQQVSVPLAVIHEPGNNTFSYTPVDGAPIEAFDVGLNTAEVIFWKITEGRGRARSYTWTFTVV